jgi:Zn-dependent M16 (insulinase) family peptidase
MENIEEKGMAGDRDGDGVPFEKQRRANQQGRRLRRPPAQPKPKPGISNQVQGLSPAQRQAIKQAQRLAKQQARQVAQALKQARKQQKQAQRAAAATLRKRQAAQRQAAKQAQRNAQQQARQANKKPPRQNPPVQNNRDHMSGKGMRR